MNFPCLLLGNSMEKYLNENIAIKIGGYMFEKWLLNTSAMTEVRQ